MGGIGERRRPGKLHPGPLSSQIQGRLIGNQEGIEMPDKNQIMRAIREGLDSLAMPRTWESQSAPGKARGIRGQATVERHGGLDVVMEKIVQREQENPASDGRKMIDDFLLWGSRRWSRTNAPPKKPRWRTWVARDFNHPNAFLSEGGAPPRCGRKLSQRAASRPSLSLLAPSRPRSLEREKGAAG